MSRGHRRLVVWIRAASSCFLCFVREAKANPTPEWRHECGIRSLRGRDVDSVSALSGCASCRRVALDRGGIFFRRVLQTLPFRLLSACRRLLDSAIRMPRKAALRARMHRRVRAERPAPELRSTIVRERLLDFLLRIHHERAVLRDGLADRSTL